MKTLLFLESKKGLSSIIFSETDSVLLVLVNIIISPYLFILWIVYLIVRRRLVSYQSTDLEHILPINRKKYFMFKLLAACCIMLLLMMIAIGVTVVMDASDYSLYRVVTACLLWMPLIFLSITGEAEAFSNLKINSAVLISFILIFLFLIFKTHDMRWPLEALAIQLSVIIPMLIIGICLNYRSFMKCGYGFDKLKRRKTS